MFWQSREPTNSFSPILAVQLHWVGRVTLAYQPTGRGRLGTHSQMRLLIVYPQVLPSPHSEGSWQVSLGVSQYLPVEAQLPVASAGTSLHSRPFAQSVAS